MERTNNSVSVSANKQDASAELVELIARIFNIDIGELTTQMDSSLTYDIGLGSLDLIKLVTEVEDHWDIRIPDEDFYDLTTINDLALYITNALSK